MPSWFQRLFFRISHTVCYLVLTLAFSMRVGGKRRMPRRGAALIIANHQSMIDPVLVGMVTARGLTYLARKTLFRNPVFAWVIRTLQAIPVDQVGVAKEGMRAVLQGLAAGRAVLVFPEGARSEDGKVAELMRGIALLIERSKVPVVPVGIAGAFAALPRGRVWPKFSPLFLSAQPSAVAVSVGVPIPHDELAKLSRDDLLTRLRQELIVAQTSAERLQRK